MVALDWRYQFLRKILTNNWRGWYRPDLKFLKKLLIYWYSIIFRFSPGLHSFNGFVVCLILRPSVGLNAAMLLIKMKKVSSSWTRALLYKKNQDWLIEVLNAKKLSYDLFIFSKKIARRGGRSRWIEPAWPATAYSLFITARLSTAPGRETRTKQNIQE